MKVPFRVAAAAVLLFAVAIGLVALWGRLPQSVFADVVKKMRSAQSFSMDVLLDRPDKPEKRHHFDQDGLRFRRTNSYGRTTIVSGGKRLSLDAGKKTARFEEDRSKEVRPIDRLLEMIEGWKVNEAKDLGQKFANGQTTKGFRTFVDTPGEREYTVEVWYDLETSYPVRIDVNYEKHNVRMAYSNFKWNPKLDASLFELRVPEGYTVVKDKGSFPVQVGSEADIKDPLIRKLIDLGGRFHWNDQGGSFNRPTAGVEPTLENVRMVYFTNSKLTDADLVHLKAMPNLTFLTFEDTPITDAGLVHLTPLNRLRYLNLDRTKVTDAGLKRLAMLANLRQLDVRGTKVTQAGVETLQQAFPKRLSVRHE